VIEIVTCFINANVITPLQRKNAVVVVDGNKISGIYDHLDITPDMKVIDAKGCYLTPGFIDIHVHGGGGCSALGGSMDDIIKMCTAHAQYGTTSILPTTSAAPIQKLKDAMDSVKAAQEKCTDSNILGIHLEGPFFSVNQKGAQNEKNILKPSECDYEDLLDYWDGIKMMGAAPEVEGALELGRALEKRNIVASVAHSDATYDETVKALEYGYKDITHIYSGCSSVIRRNAYRIAGVVEAGLVQDEYTVQMIADLKHLPVSLIKLIYKCKGADRISLITDGLEYSASELEEGTVYLQPGGLETVYEDGVMKLLDRQSFAGSVATCSKLVHNLYRHADISLMDTVKMATLTPARRIGIADRKGLIAEGYDADILLFDDAVDIKMVMVNGKALFNHLEGSIQQ
jgi:N-acetylglucosamine-6-phosphate deacetylase